MSIADAMKYHEGDDPETAWDRVVGYLDIPNFAPVVILHRPGQRLPWVVGRLDTASHLCDTAPFATHDIALTRAMALVGEALDHQP